MKQSKPIMALLLALIFAFSLVGSAAAKPPAHVPDHVKDRISHQIEKFEHRFSDLDQARWAIPYISKLTEKEVFAGYADGTFRPNKPVTRAEAMATAVRLMGLDDEAAEVDPDTELHFKDAKLIDKRFAWAKGSIVIGLQNGLFEPSEEKFDPQKPASRVWVASLMVKALGLEEEALERMTEIPDFKDAAAIPAGSIGYVNVAVDEGIVSGYTDNTFKPNKNVTRAEIAVLLAKTGELIDEEKGRVVGEISDIEFGEQHVTDDVYGETDGEITVDTYTGDSMQFRISSDLKVSFEDDFFLADELRVGDIVDLIVENGIVTSAALLLEEDIKEEIAAVQKLKIELERGDDEVYKLEYKNKRGHVFAKLERETEDGTEELKGEEAAALIESLLANLALTPEMDKEEIEQKVFSVLELDAADYEEMEMDIHFANGKKVEIKYENDEDENRDEDESSEEENEASAVKSLKLEVQFAENGKLEVNYSGKDDQAKIELQKDGNELELKSEQAAEWIKEHIQLPENKDDVDREELLDGILEKLKLSETDIVKFELKIEFNNGKDFKWEWEADDQG